MTWQDDVRYIVRVLIDDPLETTYSNDRLDDIIFVAAHFVVQEVALDSEYIISIATQTITPDPILDIDFKNLTGLRSAMIVLGAEAKTLATSAIRIKDGPSELETGRGISHIKALADNVADQYAIAKTSIASGNQGRIILTPFTSQYTDVGQVFT